MSTLHVLSNCIFPNTYCSFEGSRWFLSRIRKLYSLCSLNSTYSKQVFESDEKDILQLKFLSSNELLQAPELCCHRYNKHTEIRNLAQRLWQCYKWCRFFTESVFISLDISNTPRLISQVAFECTFLQLWPDCTLYTTINAFLLPSLFTCKTISCTQ